MKELVKFLLLQELGYGVLLLVLGVSVGIEHGWLVGAKVFLYCTIFMQFIILWVNRKVIAAFLSSDIEDAK